jgi:hypothetical protein
VYFVSGTYKGDDGDNTLTAVGFAVWGDGAHMYGGNECLSEK